MKKLLATIIGLFAITATVFAVNVTLNLSFTADEVAQVRSARDLLGETNLSEVEYAESIAHDAILEKVKEVDKRQRDIIRMNWTLLSYAEKQQIVDLVTAAAEASITNSPGTNAP